jgi:RHS repeat-associated protein
VINRPRSGIALLLSGVIAFTAFATSTVPALASANYSPSILSDAPSGYWRLGEASVGNAGVDAAGHGNTLAYSSTGTTLGQVGAIVGDSNTSATFNGSTGDATEAAAPTVVTTNWSVEAWVNPTNLNQAGTMVYNGISGSNGYGFGISSATSLTTAGSELTGIVNGAIADSGYGFPSPGTWYHVVMTRDTTTIRWYVNGKLTSKTSTLAPSAPGARFSLGAGINSSSQVVRPFLGGIDEAAVYPNQLSAGRIAAHAQDGALPITGIGQWTVRSPATVPTGRYDAAYAYDASATDATHGKLVVFGGENSASAAVQETWTWDGTNWTKLTPATQPSARWGARMAYDTATGLTYLFGGYTGSTYLNDTWKWDGTTWTLLAPTTKPSIRLDGAMAYDAATSTVVLFGGSKPTTYYADTWSWNGTNWTALTPSPAPTVRASAAVAYDSLNSKIVLYGGYNGSTYLADTWLWNGTTWTSQSPGTAPTARAGAAMAYNPITATSMLFGGVNGTSYYAETWSWDGSNWGLENSTSNPGARSTAVLAWDAATSNLVLFDGRNSSAPLTDTWNRNTPPGLASGISGVAGNTQVTVSWTAAPNGGSTITKYVVNASPGGATTTVTGNPAATNGIVTGLSNGTPYTFTVLATNALGTGVTSAASPAVTPIGTPGAPTGATATAGNAQATVSWTAPVSNGGAAISSYTITSTPGNFTKTVSGSPPATSGTVIGLTNGTPYTFTVYATNAAGNGPLSGASNSVTPSTIPGQPTNVVASGGNQQVSLVWTAPANNGATITSYTATAAPGGATATVNGNPAAAAVTVTGLTNGTPYTFTVVAHNANGDGPASAPSNSATPSVLPGAPTGVTAAASNQQATINWTAPVPNGGTAVSGYTVTPFIGTNAGTPTQVAAPTTTATISGLTNLTTYTFQVTATNTGGTGPAGTSNAVTPALTPQAPTNVGATAGNQQVTVNWTAPDPGGSSITAYTITPYIGGSAGTPVGAGAGATSVIVTGLTNGTAYTFQVYATNSYGNGFVGTSPAATPAGPPLAPINIAAISGNGQATVTWGAPTDNGGSSITGYTVTPVLNGNAGTPVVVGGSVLSTPVTGLTNGSTYTFQVFATNAVGNGSAGASTPLVVGTPGSPGNVSATGGANQISVTWTAASPNGSAITGYIATAYIAGVPNLSIGLAPSAIAATVSGLKSGTSYTIQVVATNSYGAGPAAFSSAVTPTGSATTYASTVFADGAANYERMSDTGAVAADSSGNGATGAYQGTYTHGATGLIGSDLGDAATSFDGSSAYVSAPTQTALQGDHARTVELWFNSVSSAQQMLFDSGGTGAGQAFYIGTTSDGGVCGAPQNTAGAYVGFGGNDDVYIPGLHLNDGSTHYIVVTLQGTSLSVYVDSVAVSGYVYNNSWSALTAQPFTLPTTPNTTGNPIWIGRGRTQVSCSGNTYFAGIIDEVAVYPTALSATQITNHFGLAADGAPGAPVSPSAVAGTNKATVSWGASQPNGAPVTTYVVTAFVNGITSQNEISVGGSTTSAVITGLVGGTQYNFQVQARNGFGYSSNSTYSGFVTVSGPASTYASTVIGDGPIGYYRLGDTGSTATDSSGYANSAAIKSGVTEGAGGALPGDSDTAVTSASGAAQDQSFATLPGGTSARSYEVWVKTTWTGDQVLLSYAHTNGCGYLANGLVLTSGGQVGFITSWDCNSWAVTSLGFTPPYSITNGAWHQLVATWSGTTVVMYLDGQSIGSQAYSNSLGLADASGLMLGAIYSSNYLSGSLDEVSIYPSALSAAQVLSHFQASGNSQPSAPTAVVSTGGANQATISWTAAASNGSAITGYLVTALQGGVAKNAVSVSAATTSVIMTGLQGGTAYTFQVQAANNFGMGPVGTSPAATPTGSSTTYASTVQGDSPSYYYRLDDTSAMVADSSGNGKLAYVSGGHTQGVTGALANDTDAATTLTANGKVQFAQGTGLPSGTSARTYEVWVKTTYTGDQVLLSYAHSNGCGYLANGLVLTSRGQVGFITGWDCNSWAVASIGFTPPYSITNGAWHQLVATWNGTTVFMYLDGQSIGSQAFSNSLGSADPSGLMLGAIYGSNFMSGSLDEVAIYPSALSAAQVLSHFQASANSQPSAPTDVVSAGGANQATISWTAAASNGSAITGYVVTAIQGGVARNALSVSVGTTSVIMTGLQGGTAYTFQVQAANNFGMGPVGTSPAATPTGSSTTYASTVQGDSPSYYYRLDDTSAMVADSSGNGRLAYVSGGHTQGVPGALANDADTATTLTASGRVQFAQGTGLPSGTSARTYEVWVKTTSTANQVLLSYAHSNGCGYTANGLVLTSGGQLGFITGWDCNSWAVTSIGFTPAHSITDGIWHQVAATWNGTTVVMYVDGQSIGSQAYSTSLGSADSSGLMLGAIYGSNYMSGGLDEVSIYPSALSAAQILNDYQVSGAGAPPAPTNVTAVAGVNSARVGWTAIPQGTGAVTSYTITPLIDGITALATFSATASSTSINVPGLPGGASISFAVKGINQYGTGAAGTSTAVSIQGAQAAPGMDRFLAIATGGNPARGIYYEGWTSNAAIPATSLTQWTVEGWIWAISTKNTTTGNMAWGLLNQTGFINPRGQFVSMPSADVPQAGINWNVGDLHGTNNCCDVSFVWPHNGNTSYGTDGSITPTNLGPILQGNAPVYIALDYDGTDVRGYINGLLIFTVADSASIPADALAGFFDQTELGQGAFDSFRVSSVARYTSDTFSVPTADTTADANTQVDYNFDNYPVGKQPRLLLTPFDPWTVISAGNWPDSSTHHNAASFEGVTNPWEIGWFGDSAFLVQPFEMTPGIAPGELADECNGVNTGSGNFCTRSTDMSIPGRGPALSLQRTYNSFGAGNLGVFGYGWSSTYDAHLAIDGSGNVTVHDPLGGTEFFANVGGNYNTSSYVSTKLTLSAGSYTVTDKHGAQVVYNSSGQLVSEKDLNGYVTTLAYSGSNLSTVTDPAGRTFTYTYGTNGLVSSITDGTRTVSYGYDGNLNLTSVTDVLGGSTNYTYDASHRLLSVKDPICTTTQGCNGGVNVYDTNGRVSQQTDPLGNSATYAYTSQWPAFSTTVTDLLGHQTVYDYALNMPLDIVQAANTPLAETTTYTYDPATMGVAAITNPNGEVSTAAYDAEGNLLTATDPVGNKRIYTYNSFTEPLTVQDTLGITTTNTYDSNGNLLTTSRPLVGSGTNQVTTYTYGDASHPGDLTAETDPTNRTSIFTYDTYGDRNSSTDPLGNKATYVFDSLARMTSSVSPLGNVTSGNPAAYTTSYTYNAARQPLTVTDPLSHQIVNQYDLAGHLIKTTDANGNVTIYSYDLDGRPTSSTAGYGAAQATTSTTTYDAQGHVLTQVDGLNHTLVSYTYDALNREATSADGMTRTTYFYYDASNRMTSMVNPLGQTTSDTYDSGGRLTGVTYSDGLTAPTSYTYDAGGEILSMTDGTGTTANVYDSLRRLTTQTDGAGHAVSYSYDLAGRLTGIAYPGGTCVTPTSLCVTRTYDNAGRLSTIGDWLSHQTSFGYDANSNLTGITYPNGVAATWTYNQADQLTAISDVDGSTPILSLSYTRDNNAQVTGENSNSYGYNSLNQLTAAPGLGYSYDLAGRLTQTVAGSTTTNFTYDNSDQLLSSAVVNGATTSYSYDNAGRRISSGSTTLGWNQQDRLTSYGSSAGYTYNGSGLRTSKTVSGMAEAFVWEVADGLPLLIGDGTTSYVSGPGGLPLEQINGSTVLYYQQDQLGSTRVLTDASGAVAETYTYDSYGNIASQTGSVSNPFLYSGQYRDGESGYYYLRARYYDPSTGQFISRDPKVSKTGTPYAYVADNPLNAGDPSGMDGGPDILGPPFDGGTPGDGGGTGVAGLVSYFVGAISAGFTQAVNQFCPLPPAFINGAAAGFNFDLSTNGDNWFKAGEVVGVVLSVGLLLTGPEDPLADADYARLAVRGGEAAPEAGVTLFRAVGDAEAADIAATNTYRIAGASAEFGKYFYPTVEQAQAFVTRGMATQVTSAVFPRVAVETADKIFPVNEGPAYFVLKQFFPHGPVNFLTGA